MQIFQRLFGSQIPLLIAGAWIVAISGDANAAAPTGITLSSNTVKENSLRDTLLCTLAAVDSDPGDTHFFTLVSETGGEDNLDFRISGNQLILDYDIPSDYEVVGAEIFHMRLMVTDSTLQSYEQTVLIYLADDLQEDNDGDGMTQEQEVVFGLSDLKFDTDGDGVGDSVELAAGTLATDANVWPPAVLTVGWGKANEGEQSMPWAEEFTALSTGQGHSLALSVGGGVNGWGGIGIFGQNTAPAGLTNVLALAAGGDFWIEDSAHSLALKGDGTVVGWGYRPEGMMGVPAGLGQVLAIDAGRSHGIALKNDGTVVTWGVNPFGGIEPPAGLHEVVAVAAGGFHCLALKADGTVVAWGSNFNGYEWTPATVPVGLADVVGISAGRFHDLALKQDGTVVAWGYNLDGQTNVPAGLVGVKAVSTGGFHSLALKNDGTVVAWGSNSHGQSIVPVTAQSGVRAISAGLQHSLAARQGPASATIVSEPIILTEPGVPLAHQISVGNPSGIGDVTYSAIGLPPGLSIDPLTGVISGVATHAARRAVRVQATVGSQVVTQIAFVGVSEGLPPTSVVVTPAEVLENSEVGKVVGTLSAIDPDAGDSHTFEWVDGPGATDNGLFRIEGNQLIVNQPITRDYETNPTPFSIRLRARDASLNPYEQVIQLSLLDDRSEDADGDGLSELQEADVYLTSDAKIDTDGDGFGDKFEVDRGTSPINPNVFPSGRMLVDWGYSDEAHPVPHGVMNDVIDASAGELHSLALKSDGTVVVWGSNEHGQTNVPEGLANVAAVAAGAVHNLALKNDGTVVAWGSNDVGQTDKPTDLTGVVAISAGGYHSMALTSGGNVIAWGLDDHGQSTVPASLAGVVAVAAGGFHSLALRNDGTVVAWGSAYGGAATVPEGLNGVIAIAAGGYHSLALRYNGTVVAWGSDSDGQATVPQGLGAVTEISAGWRHSLALKADGTLVAWGGTNLGQSKVPAEAIHIRKIVAGDFHNLAIREIGAFPEFADVSMVRGWPGEAVARPTEVLHATVQGSFSAMGLPADLSMNPGNGMISGTVTSGTRRAARILVPTNQGMLSRVIWVDTAAGVAPTDLGLNAAPIMENSPSGTVVGTLTAVDPNLGDTHIFEVVDGAGAYESYHFTVTGNTLKLALPMNVNFDAGITQITIRVAAVDSGSNRFEKTFTLQITNDRTEDSDYDGIVEAVEEDVLGTSDAWYESPNTADSDRDGIPGVIELAFNLDPMVAGLPLRLVAGAGSTAGLPAIDLVEGELGHHRLRMEYLRRIGDSMIYIPQFGSDLAHGGWQTAVPVVTPVDEKWERCVVMDPVSTEQAPRRFGRVAVQYVSYIEPTQDVDGDGINQALEEEVFGTSDLIANDFGNEDLEHDGVSGMIEYAFNRDPKVAGLPLRLVPGGGSAAGVPAITLVDDGAGGQRLRIEYLRRIGGILTYTPQFASALSPSAWETAANPITVTPIDEEWERCVVEDTVSVSGSERRFARVAVSW